MRDLVKTIDTAMPTLSKGQKQIAQYIQNHYDRAAYMTAAQLGEEVGISESTVVRFAAKLGFDGYPAMARAMQELVPTRLTAAQRLEISEARFRDGDILDSILNSDAEKIRYTAEHIDREAFGRAADAILHARRIYIIGMRSSAPLAEFLEFYLKYMFEDVRFVRTTSGSEVFERLMRMDERDVLLAVSFPRYSSRIVNAVKYAEQMNAKVIALTNSPDSPIADGAYAVLTARSDMVSFIDSLVAPLAIIDALLATLAKEKQKELSETLTKLESVWDMFDVYDKNISSQMGKD